MQWVKIAFKRVCGVFLKEKRNADLDEELQTHLEALTIENIRRGMTSEEARYAARREFGGMEQMKEIYRDKQGLPFLDTLLQDLRFALRTLAKRPGFTLIAILTLALGIGATTAVFSVVDRILFRSLPYLHDDRLVSFGLVAPIEQNEFMLGTDYFEWRIQQTPFESITSMTPGVRDCDLTEQNPTRLSCAAVESTFLPTFGIEPLLGRNFTHEEDRPSVSPVVLLSYGIWRARYAGSQDLLGKTIQLNGHPTRVVGVLPPNFEMPTLAHADMLVPEALDEASQQRPNTGVVLRAFARLKPGVTTVQANSALQPLFQESLKFVPPEFRKEVSLKIRSLRDRQIQDSRLASWILLSSVFAVLLLACTNVANLLLARAASRQRELAVRTALGASRARLVRQTLTESLLLGLLGGAAGCWVALVLLHLFVSIAPEGIPRLQQASLDMRVALFTIGISILCGVLFGVVPALQSPSLELLGGKEVRMTTRIPLRQTLVSAQIAISLVLLMTAGLLLRSLWQLQNTPTGMETENVLTETVSLGDYRYPQVARQFAFFTELETRLKRLPGVTSVALSDTIPPAGAMRTTIFASIEIAGHPHFAEGTGGMVGWRAVTSEYFPALSIAIIRGRGFQEKDRLSTENPIILSDTLSRLLFSNEDPIGKQMRFGLQGPWRTIVGIAANVKNNGLTANADPEFYIPWKNDPVQSMDSGQVILRSRMNPKAVASWMRAETASLDPTLPVKIDTMNQRINKLVQRPRFNAVLLTLFAVMGMLLAAIGIYGVVGFLVTQQTREIGVRMALGATSHGIFRMVLSNVVRWTIAGVLLGLLGSWYCARSLESLLFEVHPHDPLLLVSALFILLAVAFFAAWIPARRAMYVDPMIALRYE